MIMTYVLVLPLIIYDFCLSINIKNNIPYQIITGLILIITVVMVYIRNILSDISLFMIIIMITGLYILYRLLKIKSYTLSKDIIRKAFDVFEEGICYFDDDGRVILINQKMNEISSILFNKPVDNFNEFIKKLNVLKDNNILRVNDRIYELKYKTLNINSDRVNELVAYDMSTYYALNDEMKRKNHELRHLNELLNQYKDSMEIIVFERELLKAKIRIHDDAGKALLVYREYLESDGNNKEELLKIWSDTMNLLNSNGAHNTDDKLELLMDAAKAINISIEINGNIPEDEKYRNIIIAALYECLTNAKRHARADRMMVMIEETDRKIDVKITNNGIIPVEEIVESGGLSNLRKIIEADNNIMIISHRPKFMLNIIINKGE